MRIAIDARELAGKPTGVGRYLACLLEAWSRVPAAASHEFVLCAPQTIDTTFNRSLNLTTVTAPGHGTLWQQITMPRLVHSVSADIVFAPAYSGPIASRAPMVVSVHDVSFAAHPEWFAPREGLQRRLMSRLSARRARRVLTFSDFSKREIVRLLGVDPNRVEVIYHGITMLGDVDPYGRWGGPSVLDRPPQAAPLIMYAGSIFNRRHIPELIDAFTTLASRHPEARLEIVGENRTLPYIDVDALIAASPAHDRIQAHSYVTDAQLSALYRDASAFVFCSEYEGFGMTPLEALAAGIPIVVLDTEIAREIYGPAAHYVARPEATLIAAALERVVYDEAERTRILAAAPGVLARYSWQECGHRTLQVILSSAQ
jgi:glycosyltransferase involved in cell wall biosynthesis